MADDLKSWDPTMRQRAASALQSMFIKLGASPYKAMNYAQRFTGGDRSMVGLADFTPAGLLFGGEEAKLQTEQGVDALKRGDTGTGLLDTGLGLGTGALMAMGPVGKLSGNAASKFGNKAVREAKLAKKIQKAAAADAVEEAADVVHKKSPRAAVDPKIFRKMEADVGPDATLAALRKGAHIKHDGKGGLVGAPRHVRSPQALTSLRQHLDSELSDSVDAVQQADPTRLGTWYDRAKAAQSMSNEPWQLPRSLEQHGVYSSGVAPDSELSFVLKHNNSRALGEPGNAFYGRQADTLDNAVAADAPVKMGLKIGEYAKHNDPRIPNAGLFGTNDFRRAQGMTYTLPDGSPWQGGVRKEMHPFIDGETALQVDRANRKSLGGRSDWQGPHIQELPWVYDKAQDLYKRGSKGNGRFAKMTPEEGMAAAVREANNTIGDYMYKHAFGGTFEYAPGKSTGHVPEFFGWPQSVRDTYGDQGSWTRSDGLDKVYGALGFRQLPTRHGVGAYTNSAGQVESNRMSMPRILASFPTGNKDGRVAPNEMKAFNLAERMRGVVDAQEAYGGNLVNTMNAPRNKNSLLFDARTTDPIDGAWPAPEVLARVNAAMDPQGYALVPNSRGAVLMPYDPSSSSRDLKKVLKRNEGLLAEVSGDRMPGVTSSIYGPAIGKWGDEGIVPTRPFSGEATMGLLQEAADAPAAVARNLSESEEIRQAIRDKIARDAALKGTRKDIQNTRNFLSEADWNRAVELIRAGATPAAAIAALGYSVNSLAAEPAAR